MVIRLKSLKYQQENFIKNNMRILAEHLVLEILNKELAPKDFPSDSHKIRKVFVMENVQVMEQRVSNVYVMEKTGSKGTTYELISEDEFNQMNYAMQAII